MSDINNLGRAQIRPEDRILSDENRSRIELALVVYGDVGNDFDGAVFIGFNRNKFIQRKESDADLEKAGSMIW